ncbi:MAG: PhzF family phenazine biosynthesis protein [Bacteroidia bacterium]
MKLRMYQVDAFTEKLFGGNPAAVVPLTTWLSDELLQNIAMENNLAETAFYVKKENIFHIRWFTPIVEVDLCGHATLATAHVLFNHENHTGKEILFDSRSGELKVSRNEGLLTLDFPEDIFHEVELSDELCSGFNFRPVKAFKGKTDYMLVFENETQIRNIRPDYSAISKMGGRGVIATAKGDTVDFVSRFFAPQSGINEDPVTGSAHTTLTPYWAEFIDKTELTATQLSPRQGQLVCKLSGDRILISGKARTFLKGEIEID